MKTSKQTKKQKQKNKSFNDKLGKAEEKLSGLENVSFEIMP